MPDNKFDVGIQWPSNISIVIGPGRQATEKLSKDRHRSVLESPNNHHGKRACEWDRIRADRHAHPKRAIRRHCPIVSYSKT